MSGLQFSDTSGKQGLLQDCEFLLNLGDGTITGDTTLKATFTRLINSWYHKVVTMILASQDDWQWDDLSATDYPVATTPLIAGQRDYTFPTTLKILRIERVDVTYDGTNWYKVEPFDSQNTGLGLGNDTNTDGRYSKNQPFYDIRQNAIWLYPMASSTDVSAGATLRIEFLREPLEFSTSDTTKTPGIDTPFHRMLSLGASLDYATAKQMPAAQVIAPQLQEFEIRLKQFYARKDEDMHSALTAAYINYE